MGQSFMMNPYGCKDAHLLNGKWNAIIDLYSRVPTGTTVVVLNRNPISDGEMEETDAPLPPDDI